MKRKTGIKWDSLAWKTVDTSSDTLGMDDALFFGLEELDGNAYKLMKTESGSYKFDEEFVPPSVEIVSSNNNVEEDMIEDIPMLKVEKKKKKKKSKKVEVEPATLI